MTARTVEDRCPLSRTHRASLMRQALHSPWTGRTAVPPHLTVQTSSILEPGRPTSISITFDTGYHNCGWWANADYDTCWHISVTHIGEGTDLVQVPGTMQFTRRRRLEAPSDAEVRAWASAFFGEDARMGWLEPPASTSDPHRLPGVGHFRLFVDRATGEPFIPQGEVYHLKPWAGSPAKIVDGRLGADVR